MKPLFEVELELAAKGSRQAARTLRLQLKAAIIDGRLPLGARLPPTRDAQAIFAVSRNTIADVYDSLMNEGYLVARRGVGTFVTDALPTTRARSARSRIKPVRRINAFWSRPDVAAAMSFWRDPSNEASSSEGRAVDLRPAMVDARLFPHEVFRRMMAKQLRALERRPMRFKSPQGNQGNYQLRNAISTHIALTRSVACEASEMVVTAGAQQAFDLLARVLVIPNETVVAVEDPGYPPMRVAFAAAGAKLVPIGVDSEGLIVDDIPRSVGIICLCPSHQFPLGVTMSASRRRQLVDFARRHNAVIVEDDYDGEFRHGGPPLAALRTLDAADVVFYVGTFSKCMLPTLRLGFIVAPEWALPSLVTAKNCMDWHCPTQIQMAVAAFISEGHLAHHVRKMRGVYAQRREILLAALCEPLARWLEPIPSLYGMHMGAFSRVPVADLDRATDVLSRNNVKIHSFSRYYLGSRTRAGLIFGYAAVATPALARGLNALHRALAPRGD